MSSDPLHQVFKETWHLRPQRTNIQGLLVAFHTYLRSTATSLLATFTGALHVTAATCR